MNRRNRSTSSMRWAFSVAVVLAAGCGAQSTLHTADDAAGAESESAEQVAEPSESEWPDPIVRTGPPKYEWGMPWPVLEIRSTRSDDTFDIVLDDVPVPDGTDLCGAGAYVTELRHGPEFTALHIEVELDNPATYPDLEAADCERRSETIRFTAGSPLEAEKYIVIYRFGSADQYFYRDGTGFFECALPDCDPGTGLPADQPGCKTLKRDIREGFVGLDLPKRAGTETIACDDKWAIVEVDYGSAACPATGDATNDCAGRNVDRAFIRLGESGFWDVFDWDEQQGCGQVLQIEPDFPAELCRDLPELKRPSS